jgi:hypothetical protein
VRTLLDMVRTIATRPDAIRSVIKSDLADLPKGHSEYLDNILKRFNDFYYKIKNADNHFLLSETALRMASDLKFKDPYQHYKMLQSILRTRQSVWIECSGIKRDKHLSHLVNYFSMSKTLDNKNAYIHQKAGFLIETDGEGRAEIKFVFHLPRDICSENLSKIAPLSGNKKDVERTIFEDLNITHLSHTLIEIDVSRPVEDMNFFTSDDIKQILNDPNNGNFKWMTVIFEGARRGYASIDTQLNLYDFEDFVLDAADHAELNNQGIQRKLETIMKDPILAGISEKRILRDMALALSRQSFMKCVMGCSEEEDTKFEVTDNDLKLLKQEPEYITSMLSVLSALDQEDDVIQIKQIRPLSKKKAKYIKKVEDLGRSGISVVSLNISADIEKIYINRCDTNAEKGLRKKLARHFVRGHWRFYESGHSVYVNPHWKGSGSNLDGIKMVRLT